MKYTVCWYCSLVMCPLKWNLMWMFTLKHYVSLTDADLHVQLWWLWQPQFVTQGEEDHSSHGCVFSGKNCCFILSSLFEFVHVCCWGPVSFSLFLGEFGPLWFESSPQNVQATRTEREWTTTVISHYLELALWFFLDVNCLSVESSVTLSEEIGWYSPIRNELLLIFTLVIGSLISQGFTEHVKSNY